MVNKISNLHSPMDSVLVHMDSIYTPHRLCGLQVRLCALCMGWADSTQTPYALHTDCVHSESVCVHSTWTVQSLSQCYTLCHICNLLLNWEIYLLLFNETYDICPGPVFQCEFNGGVHFVIRLTIFGNFSKCAIYIPSGSIFQCEFNHVVYFGIRLTILGKFFVLYALYTIFQCEFSHSSYYVIWRLYCHNIWYGHH